MSDCIFCKIANGEIPSEFVYEDELVAAFNDISPVAPVHILIVPKAHIESALELDDSNKDIVGHVFMVASKLAHELGFAENGFRVFINFFNKGTSGFT